MLEYVGPETTHHDHGHEEEHGGHGEEDSGYGGGHHEHVDPLSKSSVLSLIFFLVLVVGVSASGMGAERNCDAGDGKKSSCFVLGRGLC